MIPILENMFVFIHVNVKLLIEFELLGFWAVLKVALEVTLIVPL